MPALCDKRNAREASLIGLCLIVMLLRCVPDGERPSRVCLSLERLVCLAVLCCHRECQIFPRSIVGNAQPSLVPKASNGFQSPTQDSTHGSQTLALRLVTLDGHDCHASLYIRDSRFVILPRKQHLPATHDCCRRDLCLAQSRT